MDIPRASLDLTHVLYDPHSLVSLALALLTLSPILLMASYAALALHTRELTIIIMWAGQFACEALNILLKRYIKQARPDYSLGNGYGFPSSHSQYMAYFASFLICHLYFQHRFSSTGSPFLDRVWRLLLYSTLLAWTTVVAYSRYALRYHSPAQILWGAGIGASFGIVYYALSERLPRTHPTSPLGRLRALLLDNPLSVRLRVRDGWAVAGDGGREREWQLWRGAWEQHRQAVVDGSGKRD